MPKGRDNRTLLTEGIAMIPLHQFRTNLRFANEVLEMMEVLKAATARQFRIMQGRRKGFEPFHNCLNEFMGVLGVGQFRHPFLLSRVQLPKAILVITSDEGFLGSLNANVVSLAFEQANVTDEIIVMGERGARHLSEMYSGAFTVLPALGDDISYERAGAVRDLLIGKYLTGRIGKVLIVHARFLSLTVQEPFVTKLLPCPELFQPPEQKKRFVPGQVRKKEEVFIEPGPAQAVDFLVRATLTQQLYAIFLDSKLAEYAARIVHLEGSYQEITEMNRRVLFSFFKHLHQKSDKDIREIFASRLKGVRLGRG